MDSRSHWLKRLGDSVLAAAQGARGRLVGAFLLVALGPLAGLGYLTYTQTTGALSDEVFRKRVALRDAKAERIESYFAQRLVDARALAGHSGQVTQSFDAIAEVSQQTSAALEQVSAAAGEMNTRAAEVAESAHGLATLAGALRSAVAHFQAEAPPNWRPGPRLGRPSVRRLAKDQRTEPPAVDRWL